MTETQKLKMNKLMYSLIENSSNYDYDEFLQYLDISEEDYEAIKKEWAKIGISV